jgi:hypothetical protein
VNKPPVGPHFDLLTVTIGGAILAVGFVAVFGWLNRRHALTTLLRGVLSRFAPAFLIIAPPIITYGFVCGALSFGFGLFCVLLFEHHISNPEAFFRPVFKGFEYLCGIGCGYLWIRLAAWLGLRWPWYLFILTSHGLVAGYREARFDYGGRGMGPTVTEDFVLLDAVIPILAFLPYYLFHARRNAEPSAAPNGGPAASVDSSNAPGGPPSVS